MVRLDAFTLAGGAWPERKVANCSVLQSPTAGLGADVSRARRRISRYLGSRNGGSWPARLGHKASLFWATKSLLRKEPVGRTMWPARVGV